MSSGLVSNAELALHVCTVRVDDRENCAFCGTNLDAADAVHEANVTEMRRAAQALRDALAERDIEASNQ